MITTISTKGQLVLPQELRDQLGWSEGDRVQVESDGEGRVILENVKSLPNERLVDLLLACPLKGWNIPRLPRAYPCKLKLT